MAVAGQRRLSAAHERGDKHASHRASLRSLWHLSHMCVCGDEHAQCQGGSRIGATAQGPLAHHRRPCARRQTRLASRARLLTLRPSSHTCMWETSTRNIKAVVERTRRGHRQAAPPHCHAPFVPRHSSSPCARSVAATGTTSKYCTCAIYFAPRPRRRPSHPNLM